MIDSKAKLAQLEKISRSSGFVKSRRYSELLQYLVESEIEGKSVKEKTIAIELFKKDTAFAPAEDTIVRVSMVNLRKRLSNYYFTEGKSDKLRIEIPKGGYNVVFREVKPGNPWVIARENSFILLALSSLFIVLLGVISFLLFQNRKLRKHVHPVVQNDPVWSDFSHSSDPTTLVLGDYFFMYESHELENRRIFIRDSRINNLEEFEEKSSLFYREWQPLEFTYLRKAVVMSAIEISSVLGISSKELLIKQASELEWEDFNNSNIIYVGTIKSLYKLEKLLPSFNLQIERDSVYQMKLLDEADSVSDTFVLPRLNQNTVMTDYAYIGKKRGPENHVVMVIASGDEVGLANAVSTIASARFPHDLLKVDPQIDYGSPFYFEMIIKTVGLRRTGFENEIVYFKSHSE